jgi:predicted RNA-binding Zn ribbon-like protein
LFAHDTEDALTAAVALVNTADEPDALTTQDDLDTYLDQWEWTGRRDHDDAELRAVRALRPRLRELWTADDESRVEIVNDLLRSARAMPQLVRHGSWPWHLHATTQEAPLATRMAVEAAMAMVDVIRSDATDRLSICAAPDCENVVVDLSKNRSRKYCDAGCTNRMAAAAYRARQSEG